MRAAVIGAGIAGLNLARRLEEMGIEVQIFEKARGPSGRISTRRTGSGEFDHGAQYFTARDAVFKSQVEDWCARGIVATWEGRIVRVREGQAVVEASDAERYVGKPKMSAVARDLAYGREVEVGVRIQRAERDAHRWRLTTDAGFEYAGFDWLMVATPAPQALPFLGDSSLLSAEVGSVRMLPCHALMVTFAAEVAADFDAAFVDSNREDAALSWVARNSSKPERAAVPCWVLHSRPEWSQPRVDLAASEVTRRMLMDLERVLGTELPAVAFSTMHRWLLARPEKPLSGRALWDSSVRVGVCGDWLQGDRVEDAYLSAERLADALRPILERG